MFFNRDKKFTKKVIKYFFSLKSLNKNSLHFYNIYYTEYPLKKNWNLKEKNHYKVNYYKNKIYIDIIFIKNIIIKDSRLKLNQILYQRTCNKIYRWLY